MRRTKQIDVSRALALAAAFNFLCSASRGCLLPFLSLYLRRLGLDPLMTGAVMAARHLAWLLSGPAASALSKRYDKRRALISSSLLCSAAVALALLLVPATDVRTAGAACNASVLGAGPYAPTGADGRLPVSPPGVTLPVRTTTEGEPASVTAAPQGQHGGHDSRQTARQETVSVGGEPDKANASSAAAPHVRRRRSEVEEGPGGEERSGFDFLQRLKVTDPQRQLFFLVLITVSLWEGAAAPLEWTADDGVYEYLDSADASDRHGAAAPWALVGAACGAGGAGVLVARLSCVPAHFFLYAALAAAAVPVACCLPLHLNRKRERASGLLRALQLVRGSAHAALCAVTVALAGAAGSAVDNFLLWQMQDHGGQEPQMGGALAAALLARAAFPALAGRATRLLAPGRLLAAGAATLAFQCFYYSFLWGPWVVLPAQVLSCLSGGALWWAVEVQCRDVAAPEAQRSVRRLYGALSLQVGGGVGSLAGGALAQRAGLTWLFRAAAALLALWCPILLLLQLRTPRQRRINYSRLLAADASEASESESEQERHWLDKDEDADLRHGNNNDNNNTRRIGR